MLAVSNYHYIREDFSAPHPSIFGVTPQQFKEQLEKLAKQGTFISQEKLLDFRNKLFDKNYILITFDDGLKEQYQMAKPILDAMGIPFLAFINTSNFSEKKVSTVHKIHLLRSKIPPNELLSKLSHDFLVSCSNTEKQKAITHYNYDSPQTAIFKYLLNFKLTGEEQQKFIDILFRQHFNEKEVVRELYFEEDMLMELSRINALGSHSHHHVPLAKLNKKAIKKELEATQHYFAETFGEKAAALSFPYGSLESCTGLSETLKNHDFKLAFTMERAVNKEVNPGEMLLSRYDCNDLPGGKANLFGTNTIFENPTLRKWQNESCSVYER